MNGVAGGWFQSLATTDSGPSASRLRRFTRWRRRSGVDDVCSVCAP
jgi:hypothetical protein